MKKNKNILTPLTLFALSAVTFVASSIILSAESAIYIMYLALGGYVTSGIWSLSRIAPKIFEKTSQENLITNKSKQTNKAKDNCKNEALTPNKINTNPKAVSSTNKTITNTPSKSSKTSNNQLIILTIKDKEVIYKTEKAIKKAIILTIKNKEVIYKTEKEVKKITVIKSTPEQIVYKDRNQIKIASLNKKNNYSYNPNNNIQSINSRIINSKSTDNQKRKIRKK